MKNKAELLLKNKSKTVPILSFPAASLISVSIKEMLTDPEIQAKAMTAMYERGNVGAIVTPMDLSVEAECFGAPIRMTDDEVPSVISPVLEAIEDVHGLTVPSIDGGRCPVFIESTRLVKSKAPEALVLCGAIGPYSLAGRIFDMTELMMQCFDSPDEVKLLLSKTTEFIINYLKAHKAAGADGVILAEPAAGLLPPDMCEEFSSDFVKEIKNAVADENFLFCYHNCGGSVNACAEDIASIEADIFHFGNAVDIKALMDLMPEDSIVMGNVDPLLFRDGTVLDVENTVLKVFAECASHENFMISSGCDIPADSKWENLDAYFKKVDELYV